ncbi:hypothetical protein BdWA1_001808 [Babesia duncani]|uniref:Uncharacterized protein n=1 Tax=Babesia duncani TaxID=323732 RepID=A0AAD9PGJ5_9APIC|nr:hypothetical protein BdWA1_004107 [Babesia duncani]KAK2196561.1 hypothetical protein BdWA1_001808 [Babesia duncani]
MAATNIFKSLRLEDEIRSLLNSDPSSDDFIYAGSRNLLLASRGFSRDAHSLPSGTDERLKDLYPYLQELRQECNALSQNELERMANDLHVACKVPDVEYSPINYGSSYITPGYGYNKGISDSGRKYSQSKSYVIPQSVDYEFSSTRYPKGLFSDTNKSREPTSVKLGAFADDIIMNVDDFNLDEFTTAFQPGNEYRTEYTSVETPIGVDRASKRNEVSLSPFTWNKTGLSAPKMDNVTRASSPYRPSTRSMDAYSKFDFGNANKGICDDSLVRAGFSPTDTLKQRSPIHSIVNDSEYSYGRRVDKTPSRPFYEDSI